MGRGRVIYTKQAQRDINNILDYIEFELHNRTAAYKKARKINAVKRVLSEHLQWHHAYRDNPWKEWNLYIYHEDNYRFVHVPNLIENQTVVIRVLHGMQDLEQQLEQTDTGEL